MRELTKKLKRLAMLKTNRPGSHVTPLIQEILRDVRSMFVEAQGLNSIRVPSEFYETLTQEQLMRRVDDLRTELLNICQSRGYDTPSILAFKYIPTVEGQNEALRKFAGNLK